MSATSCPRFDFAVEDSGTSTIAQEIQVVRQNLFVLVLVIDPEIFGWNSAINRDTLRVPARQRELL